MELSWTTFILEIINFLVLLWILKRFLYKPVLDVIARRRADIDKQLSDAETLQQQAQTMREQYEGRLNDWERERQRSRDTLHAELEEERQRRLDKLGDELAEARQRAEVAASRRLANDERKIEATALQHASQFATRLLQDASGPDTQSRLVNLFIKNIAELTPESVIAIQRQFGGLNNNAIISSAYPLDTSTKQALEAAMRKILPPDTEIQFDTDNALLAGLRVIVGAWELGINIQDELRGFAELAIYG